MKFILNFAFIFFFGVSSFANKKGSKMKTSDAKKEVWMATFDNTMDPRGSFMFMKKQADGYFSPDVIEITVDNPEFPFYKEILGEFKKDETKQIASMEDLKKKVEKMKKQKEASLPKKPPMPDSVGTATMKEDGTLYMQFRSVDRGMIAEALKIVKKDDPDYQKMIDHLGGIKPGQAKSIPPFGD